MYWVFGVKEGRVLVMTSQFWAVLFIEMWKPGAEAGWEDKTKFHCDEV